MKGTVYDNLSSFTFRGKIFPLEDRLKFMDSQIQGLAQITPLFITKILLQNLLLQNHKHVIL